MNSAWRRWRLPAALSLLINIFALGASGIWFHTDAFQPPRAFSIKRVQLVEIPKIAPVVKPVPPPLKVKIAKLRPDRRVHEAQSKLRQPARATKAGAKRVLRPIRHLKKITPTTPHPQMVEQPTMKDPFQPDVAPSVMLTPPTNAQHVQEIPALPTPPAPVPTPVQIAPVTGTGTSATPSPTPVPSKVTTAVAAPAATAGPPHAGGGGSGTGMSGNGNGGGGVLPFGLGGRGGSSPVWIVYVLDVSPSMVTRIDRARAELFGAMNGLTDQDMFDIFRFGGEVVKMENYMQPPTRETIREAHRFLDVSWQFLNIPSTNLEAALTDALDMFNRDSALTPGHVNQIVVITDGEPNEGESRFDVLEREIHARNIHHVRIDTVGLSGIDPNDPNETPEVQFKATALLKGIAADNEGQCKIVPVGELTPD